MFHTNGRREPQALEERQDNAKQNGRMHVELDDKLQQDLFVSLSG